MLTTAREADELIVAVRFPVHKAGGVAFRETARRHGDFAIVVVAALVEDKERAARRRRHGGHAGRGAYRSTAVKDAIEKIARDLEGYEDLHASAELRRDILRNLAPVVIAEAQSCAA